MARPEPRREDDDQATLPKGAAALRPHGSGENSPPDPTNPSDAPTLVGANRGRSDSDPPASASQETGPSTRAQIPILRPQSVLGNRYEILNLVGQGGMGAVYKAKDREVNQFVALKVIRPDLAGNAAIIERFKQELVLARQVTHKNVIRIYDLAEADGMKFITMEYVEGIDLRTLIIEKKKLAMGEAVEIMRQVCLALEAAHSVVVIHRDLKPQNIMRDKTGRVLVMDFGLARTLEGSGMTQTGVMVGTLEYMSPEQALGTPLDQRSDLFTVGLIFYELLTGKMPYRAHSAVASLIKRTQERALPVSDEDNSIPSALSTIVSKCLERDLSLRYQHVTEILSDLDTWQGKSAASPRSLPPLPHEETERSSKFWNQIFSRPVLGNSLAVLLGSVLALVVLVVASVLFTHRLRSPSAREGPSAPVVSLAVLPFHNLSGDPSLNWIGPSVAEMLSTDIGQSSRVRTVSPDRMHQILIDLRVPADTAYDPATVRRAAEFSNSETLIWGQYVKSGDHIRIEATLQNLKNGRTIPLTINAVSETDIPAAVDRIAASIRQNLSVSPDVLKELQASSFQPSSKSVAALREYNSGVQSMREGRNLDALKDFQSSTREDPEFALAFSRMAETYSRLGYDSEAEQSARKAVELSGNLPATEKFLIAANQLRIAKDYPKAVDAYQNLAKVSPDNSDIQSALGSVYENSGDFAKAREFYQKLLTANPKDLNTLVAMGRIEILSGNPQASLDPLDRGLSLAIQTDNQEQKGTILHVLGASYTYLNKPDDALQNYKQALDIRKRLGQKKGVADSLNMIAGTYDGLGKSDLAFKNYNDALHIYREIGDQQDMGNVLANVAQYYDDRGRYDEALKLFKEALQINRDLHNENNEAIALNNIGNTYLFKGDYNDARIYFEQALQLREKINVPSDIASTLHNLAEVSTKSGQYEQALTQYMRALELYRKAEDKHGTAVEAYSMGTIFEYQGRYGSAESSKQQALQDFREVKENSFWMGEVLSGHGNALSETGRFEESAKALDEALAFSRQLKNDALIAQALNWQGDNSLYRGDHKSARSLYEQALRTASKTTDRHLVLVSKLNSAKIIIEEGQPQNAIKILSGVVEEAETLGLKYLSIECSIYEAQARMQLKDYRRAQPKLERAVLQSENLGLKPLLMRAHFLLGKVLREQGAVSDAIPHYQKALELLAYFKKDPGADKIMERADFKAIYTESDQAVR